MIDHGRRALSSASAYSLSVAAQKQAHEHAPADKVASRPQNLSPDHCLPPELCCQDFLRPKVHCLRVLRRLQGRVRQPSAPMVGQTRGQLPQQGLQRAQDQQTRAYLEAGTTSLERPLQTAANLISPRAQKLDVAADVQLHMRRAMSTPRRHQMRMRVRRWMGPAPVIQTHAQKIDTRDPASPAASCVQTPGPVSQQAKYLGPLIVARSLSSNERLAAAISLPLTTRVASLDTSVSLVAVTCCESCC